VRREAKQQHSPQISTANSTRPQPSVLGTLCTRSASSSRTSALPVQTFVSPEATGLVRPPLARTAYPTFGSDTWASNFQPSSPIAIGSPHSTAHQAGCGCIARPESTWSVGATKAGRTFPADFLGKKTLVILFCLMSAAATCVFVSSHAVKPRREITTRNHDARISS
jgi:hypothetical protein